MKSRIGFRRGNQNGQTALLFAMGSVVMFGTLGLVVDVGYAYYRREAAQAAADAAATAAAFYAYQAAGGGAVSCSTATVSCYSTEQPCAATLPSTPTNNIEAGCLYARDNGFRTTGRQKVTIQSGTGTVPTTTGTPMNYWVVVRVSERLPQLFSAVLGDTNAMVTARATTATRVADAGGCVMTLNPHYSGALRMTGSTSLTAGCGVFVNSDMGDAISIVGGGTINTGSAKTNIVGNWSGSGTITPAPITGAPSIIDPLEDLTPPSYSGCDDGGGGIILGSHSSQTLTPTSGTAYVICGGIDLSSHATLTLNPGLYVVKNGISLGAQTALSSTGGVTIYVETGGVSMAGGATVNLTATTSGTWQGVLFFQARGNTSASNLVGGTSQAMNGILYFPSAPLTYTGGSSTVASNTTIISDTLSLVGNSYITAAASSPYTGITGGAFMIE